MRLTLETYFKVRSYARMHLLLNKNMSVLITDEKKDDGSVEGNVVLKVIPQKKKFQMKFFETFPECFPPALFRKKQ